MALMFTWGAYNEFRHIQKTVEPEHPTWTNFKWYIAIARGCGYTLNLNCAIIILLASRLFITFIRETPLHRILPLDKSFPEAHIIVGYCILVGVAIHVPFHFVWLFTYKQFDEFKLWSFSMSVAMGVPLMLIFLLMFGFALPSVRQKYFRTFYVIHLAGAAAFFALLLLHGMYRKVPETYKWIGGPLAIYIIDRIIRRCKISACVLRVDRNNSTLKPGEILMLEVPKQFNYRAGQYAEISVLSLGKEWHPFTIASAPHEDVMRFYIKAAGNWTNDLYSCFQRREGGDEMPPLQVRIRGPFGAPAQNVGSFKRVVLISGGIGSTPFVAISKYLHYCSSTAQQTQDSDGGADDFMDNRLRHRIRAAIDEITEVPIEVEDTHDEDLRELQRKHASDALSLDHYSMVPVKRVTAENAKETQGADEERGYTKTRRFPVLRHFRARFLSVLHSTRVILCLLFSLVARFALVCILAIWKRAEFGFSTTFLLPGTQWALLVDAVLSFILVAVLGVTLFLEITYMKVKFFARTGRCIDLLALGMLAWSATVSIGSYRSPMHEGTQSAFTILHFGILLPLEFILLSFRMHRSIGVGLLNPNPPGTGFSCPDLVPDTDFLWTIAHNKDDEWLRQDLSPLSKGTELRLQRYVTREKEPFQENPEEKHIVTAAGRPKWDTFFAQIADKTRSGGEVGVFFCGPPKMGYAIQRALRAVEVYSNILGLYMSLDDEKVKEDFGIKNEKDLRLLRRFGCNVRFVFREENF